MSQAAEEGPSTALHQVLVAENVRGREVVVIAGEEPVENDDLAAQQLRLVFQCPVQIGVQLLAGGKAAPIHREVHRLPGGQHRQGVAHQGEDGKGIRKARQEGREERVVLHQQGEARGQGLVDHDLPPLSPQPAQALSRASGRLAVVVEMPLDLHRGRPALRQDPCPHLLGELADAHAGAQRRLHPSERPAANGFRESHRVRQLARQPAIQRGPGAGDPAQEPRPRAILPQEAAIRAPYRRGIAGKNKRQDHAPVHPRHRQDRVRDCRSDAGGDPCTGVSANVTGC